MGGASSSLSLEEDLRQVQEQPLPTSDVRDASKLPVCYSPNYKVSLLGLESLHPFHINKYTCIHAELIRRGRLTAEQFYDPGVANDHLLTCIHPLSYVRELESSATRMAQVAENPIIAILPASVTRRALISAVRAGTCGSVLAGTLAVHEGWAVNLSGGYHHCSAERGGGFCFYADISLILVNVRRLFPSRFKKFLIVDLDAHQGNGHENDHAAGVYAEHGASVFIFDMYNASIYPNDVAARAGISDSVRLRSGDGDEVFMTALRAKLPKIFAEFQPDYVIYNAGTDLLRGDPLGLLDVSPECVAERDQVVFELALRHRVPIVMLLSGGYQKTNWSVITDSLCALDDRFHLFRRTDAAAGKAVELAADLPGAPSGSDEDKPRK